ncbi:YdaS family helix-turn-helix protein [Citrobacter sp. Cb034]|uniref:YdaS family helix-turn-helix protein n=1 Tax=Citrobacter sp. Cb034 TaxID=2985026 RepID=UPI0025780E20|nr:YdaS family helix-turn-helix protein [Citrobacter sp. Cb034]MDM3434569.1 helix-turn-helix domain-containing protein [Citrobacter sp. Cb034]
METLKTYMANLTPEEKKQFALNCGTTLNYLRKVMSTGKPIGPEICAQIEIHSGGEVSRKSLKPNNWQKIWPELLRHNHG